jgi:hypothetical protein
VKLVILDRRLYHVPVRETRLAGDSGAFISENERGGGAVKFVAELEHEVQDDGYLICPICK